MPAPTPAEPGGHPARGGRGGRRRRRSTRSQGPSDPRPPADATPAPTPPPPEAPPAEAPPAEPPPAATTSRSGSSGRSRGRRTRGRGEQPRMRTVDETSAGGLVVAGLDGPHEERTAALIGRTDRRGRLLWSLPKGHLEVGETAVQAAEREVAEETGIDGTVLAPLGSIDYWFVTEGRRVHKTVHHYLLRFVGGELSDADVEVTEVAWVPLTEMEQRLAYADERRLVRTAESVIAGLASTTTPVPMPDVLAPPRVTVGRRRPGGAAGGGSSGAAAP